MISRLGSAGEIRAETPPWAPKEVSDRTGAEKRDKAEPLDGRLRNKIILGDRPVVATPGYVPDTRTRSTDRKIIPATGAVGRPAPQKVEPVQPAESPQESRTPPWQERQQRSDPVVQPQKERSTPPVVKESPRSDPPKQRDTPPVRTEQPRSEPTKTARSCHRSGSLSQNRNRSLSQPAEAIHPRRRVNRKTNRRASRADRTRNLTGKTFR